MNTLERSLVQKAGYAHGWENVRESAPNRVVMYSSRHRAEAHVTPSIEPDGPWRVTFPKGPATAELARTLPQMHLEAGVFEVSDETSLGILLRRAAELAMSLPDHAFCRYAEEVARVEAEPPLTTEVLRLVKQRIGQDIFRDALMEYWGGACAVTAIAIPELLRASHSKPWSDCATDTERLNVFNGFLLCAHLDALFDKGLLTFDSKGGAVLSHQLDADEFRKLGLPCSLKLRWLSAEHGRFLEWHRQHVYKAD